MLSTRSSHMPVRFSRIVWVYLLPLLVSLLYLSTTLLSFSIIVLSVLTALAVSHRPVWGGYLLVFFIPIAGDNIGFHHADSFFLLNIPLFGALLILVLLVLGLRKGARIEVIPKTTNPAAIPVIFFGFYALLVFIWKSNALSPVVFGVLMINIVLFFFVFNLSCSSDEIFENIVRLLIAAGTVTALLTVFSVLFHPDISIKGEMLSNFDFRFSWDPGRSRYRGYAFELSNFTSRTLNLTTCLIVGKLLYTSRMKKGLALAALLILVVFANCLTSSKGGLFGFLVMMSFILLFSRKLNKTWLTNYGILLAGFVVIYIFGILFVSIVGEAFRATTLGAEGSAVSISTRLEYWAAGIKMLLREDAFLTGLGLGGWDHFVNIGTWPHSLYFSFLFDFGMLGIVFILSLLGVMINCALKLRLFISQQNRYEHMALCLFGGFLAIGVHGLVEFYYNQSITWLYLALLFAALQTALQRRDREWSSSGQGEAFKKGGLDISVSAAR